MSAEEPPTQELRAVPARTPAPIAGAGAPLAEPQGPSAHAAMANGRGAGLPAEPVQGQGGGAWWQRPEAALGGAFIGGLLLAALLRRRRA